MPLGQRQADDKINAGAVAQLSVRNEGGSCCDSHRRFSALGILIFLWRFEASLGQGLRVQRPLLEASWPLATAGCEKDMGVSGFGGLIIALLVGESYY